MASSCVIAIAFPYIALFTLSLQVFEDLCANLCCC